MKAALTLATLLALTSAANAQYPGAYGADSGQASTTITPANSSHAAGSSVGGLFAIPMARTIGGSGIATNVIIQDTNGVAETYLLRVWSHQPANTTCTDATAFVTSSTDNAFLVGYGPTAVSTVAPTNTTGDAFVYANLSNLVWDYATAGNTNLYVCLVTTATYTPAATKPITIIMSGIQN